MSEAPVRVFISYAHEEGDPGHGERVRNLWRLLRACGIDAQLDLPAAERRQDWALWMLRGMRDSRYVLVVASPEYKETAEGDAPADRRRGVRWEAAQLRKLVYEDPERALDRIVPVVLPGGSAENLPDWLGGSTTTVYEVRDFSPTGAERLLRLLTGQPYETTPALGPVHRFPSRDEQSGRAADVGEQAPERPLLLPPAVVESPPVPRPAPPSPSFRFPDPWALVDALMSCEPLHRLAVRHELLSMMGEFLGLGRPFEVPEDPEARTHLRRLVRVSSGTVARDATLTALLRALEQIAPHDAGTARVRALLVAGGLPVAEV